MSQVEILILAQVAFFLIAAIVFLILLLRRNKKTIARLQSLLVDYQEEASGESLVKHLQLAIDDTTAHCAQETINLLPDANAEDQAISLRYAALTYELRLLQSNNGESTPWRTIIQPYNELAKLYFDHIQSIPDKVKVKFKGQMADMDKEHQRLEETISQLTSELKQLAPIQDFFKQEFDENATKNDIELSLHTALVALCDTVERAEGLREVVYLIHEAYYERGESPSESTTFETTPTSTDTTEPGKHTVALNNIISEQNKLIHNLRTQLSQSEELEGGSELTAHLDVLEQNFNAAQIQITQLEEQLKAALENAGESSDAAEESEIDYSQDEMFELIEQFTEESADMIERLHMLQNKNKQITKENDELREQLVSTAEPGDETEPLVAGLKIKIESQNSEILQLQQAFKDVEDKYLALYEETMEDMIGSTATETAQATIQESPEESIQNPIQESIEETAQETIPDPTVEVDTPEASPTANTENDNGNEASDDIITDISDIDDILASANIDMNTDP